MSTWTVEFDDGENLQTATASGKLSLDHTWMFIMDPNRPVSTIVLAIPARCVISIKEDLS